MARYLPTDRGLQINQSGRDLKKLDEKRAVDSTTGFWENVTFVTSKPPRWIIQFDATGNELSASVPDQRRADVIGYANTQAAVIISVRILPIIKLRRRQI